ncbi:MAG: DUF1684 domain-containing protein [Trueperaceae bacterium]
MAATELPTAGAVATWRAAKDDYLKNHRTSPLYGDDSFGGLAYYPETSQFRVAAQLERTADAEPVLLATSTGDERMYLPYGVARFQLGGQDQSLVLYATPDAPEGPRLFVPFRDATSGPETYGAGRYLEFTLEDEGAAGPVTLDFNYAYHPYCAYAEGYSCPFPPSSNWLSQPVRAGEKLPDTADPAGPAERSGA